MERGTYHSLAKSGINFLAYVIKQILQNIIFEDIKKFKVKVEVLSQALKGYQLSKVECKDQGKSCHRFHQQCTDLHGKKTH